LSFNFILVPIVSDQEATELTPGQRARKARQQYDFRRRRERHIPRDLLGEPAWDIMLLIYFLEFEGKPVSVAGICAGCGVSNTSGLRWQAVLEKHGWIARRADPRDRRRLYVELTREGRSMMDRLLDQLP
jgi:hypothetical protein